MITIEQTITDIFAPIREQLAAAEARLLDAQPGEHQEISAATRHLLSSGGKRVRPAISLLASGALGVEWNKATTLAAAVEMLHTATLVHDDLIDGSLLRRGIPTLNANWTPAATVLTGDYLFARASSLAAATGNIRVMEVFSRTLMVLVNGEINQMFKSPGRASRDDYYRRIYAKTASMFELATESAAILSRASETDIQAMATFGRQIGIAFQIVDDILDFVGTSAQIGKPVGSDLLRGLVTLPALCYIEHHPGDPNIRALLNGKMGDRALTARVVETIRESGAVQQALNEARDYIEQGQDAIAHLPGSRYHDALLGVANYFIDRDI